MRISDAQSAIAAPRQFHQLRQFTRTTLYRFPTVVGIPYSGEAASAHHVAAPRAHAAGLGLASAGRAWQQVGSFGID
jgi:hypothetical protein